MTRRAAPPSRTRKDVRPFTAKAPRSQNLLTRSRGPPLTRNKAPAVPVRGRNLVPALKGKSRTTPAVQAPFNWKSQIIKLAGGPKPGSGKGGLTTPFAVGPRTVKRRGPDLY
jgi:hypothetical protein